MGGWVVGSCVGATALVIQIAGGGTVFDVALFCDQVVKSRLAVTTRSTLYLLLDTFRQPVSPFRPKL